MRVSIVALLGVAACLFAVATAAADPTCSRPIQPIGSSNLYDLSWWTTNGPFATKDITGTYTYNFGICNSLPTPCKDTASGPSAVSACAAPNSAYACQSWNNPSNPSQPYTTCAAGTSVAPQYLEYSDQNGERGIIVMAAGGDDCSICEPQQRAMQYVIFCDAKYQNDIQIVQVTTPNAPSPIASIVVRHCSGCALGTSGACPGTSQLTYNLDMMFNTNSSNQYSIGLMPPPIENSVTVKSNYGNDLSLSGRMTPGHNASLTVMVRTSSAIGFGTLTFADSNTVSMTFRDAFNKKGYVCYPQKQSIGSVTFVCPYDNNGALAVVGTVN